MSAQYDVYTPDLMACVCMVGPVGHMIRVPLLQGEAVCRISSHNAQCTPPCVFVCGQSTLDTGPFLMDATCQVPENRPDQSSQHN